MRALDGESGGEACAVKIDDNDDSIDDPSSAASRNGGAKPNGSRCVALGVASADRLEDEARSSPHTSRLQSVNGSTSLYALLGVLGISILEASAAALVVSGTLRGHSTEGISMIPLSSRSCELQYAEIVELTIANPSAVCTSAMMGMMVPEDGVLGPHLPGIQPLSISMPYPNRSGPAQLDQLRDLGRDLAPI